jgi:hypothetical protein
MDSPANARRRGANAIATAVGGAERPTGTAARDTGQNSRE